MTANEELPRRITEDDVQIAIYDVAGDPDNVARTDLFVRDPMLTAFVAFFTGVEDDGDGSVGLTLTVSGTAVSGLVISEAEWQAAMLATLDGHSDLKDQLAIVFEDYNMAQRVRRQARIDRDLPPFARKFIHLRDVMIGTGKVATVAPLWRGLISDVSGWSVGSHNGVE